MKQEVSNVFAELKSRMRDRHGLALVMSLGDWRFKEYEAYVRTGREGEKYFKARCRLVRATDALISGKPVPKKERDWLALLLCEVLQGKDIRATFHSPSKSRPGRKIASDDHKCLIAIDSLLIAKRSGGATTAGKKLWAILSKKWGPTDGSVKNFLTQYRDKATHLVKHSGLSLEEWELMMVGWHRAHKKSQK